jgi:hypothetical protein
MLTLNVVLTRDSDAMRGAGPLAAGSGPPGEVIWRTSGGGEGAYISPWKANPCGARCAPLEAP